MATLTLPSYTKSGGKSTSTVKLDKTVFGVMPDNHELLKLVYTAYLSNGRNNLALTKTRGLVRGGGRKPHKQKGTGRARAGSIRSPIWRGGGVVFGPTGQENYTKKLPKNAKRLALRQALSLAAEEGRIKILDAFEPKEGKVRQAHALLSKLDAGRSVLIVVEQTDALVQQATRNMPNVKVATAMYLNVFDIMNADTLIFSKKALEQIHDWLGEKK